MTIPTCHRHQNFARTHEHFRGRPGTAGDTSELKRFDIARVLEFSSSDEDSATRSQMSPAIAGTVFDRTDRRTDSSLSLAISGFPLFELLEPFSLLSPLGRLLAAAAVQTTPLLPFCSLANRRVCNPKRTLSRHSWPRNLHAPPWLALAETP